MKQIRELLGPMVQHTRSCFLIGSQTLNEKILDKARDIDLVFIIDHDEKRIEAAVLMQTIQGDSEFHFIRLS